MVTHTRLELVLPTWEAGVLTARRMGQKMVPRVGLEPTTPSLRVICSTNWANEARLSINNESQSVILELIILKFNLITQKKQEKIESRTLT